MGKEIKGTSPILNTFKGPIKTSKYSKKSLRDKLVTSLAGGVKGKPHASKEGIEAAAGRKFDRIALAGGLRRKTKKK